VRDDSPATELGLLIGTAGLGDNRHVKKPEVEPVVARNRKAAHDYQLGESWEAGIVLEGPEVKALRAGRASLVGGFAQVEGREMWLHGVHIPQYSQSRWFNGGSRRKRKLLLHRAQIDKIDRKVNESGLTIVPIALYFKDGRAKVEIALARGKKVWDKRNALAEREATREVERALNRHLKGHSN
jgi:SsrA-binding protein